MTINAIIYIRNWMQMCSKSQPINLSGKGPVAVFYLGVTTSFVLMIKVLTFQVFHMVYKAFHWFLRKLQKTIKK